MDCIGAPINGVESFPDSDTYPSQIAGSKLEVADPFQSNIKNGVMDRSYGPSNIGMELNKLL